MHFVKAVKQDKEWVYITDIIHTSFATFPGGVKMACSSALLAIIVWTSLQFGSQFDYASNAVNAFRLPISLQSFVNSNGDSPTLLYGGRSIRKSVDKDGLKAKNLIRAVEFVQRQVDTYATMEENINSAGKQVEKDSPAFRHFIESKPDTTATKLSKDAFIAVKTTQYLSYVSCERYGVQEEECAKLLSSVKMDSTSLKEKCIASNGMNIICPSDNKYRSLDGSCNHRSHPGWGKSFTAYRRLTLPKYADGLYEPRSSGQNMRDLPSPYVVTSDVVKDLDLPDNIKTLALMQWTQFVHHDMAHTPVSTMFYVNSSIMCCDDDGWSFAPRYLHPFCMQIVRPSDGQCMNYVRSVVAMRPDCTFGPAEQMNQATHYLDGSMIYGQSEEKARSLRTMQSGRLECANENGRELLPLAQNPDSDCKNASDEQNCYRAGDTRVNQHPHLTAMHTLWLREHNRIADNLAKLNPHWTDEELYQQSRRIVIAEIQHITYAEWLPLILGETYAKKMGLNPVKSGFSTQYDENVDPSVTNSFATSAINFLYSLINSKLQSLRDTLDEEATVKLADNFNVPVMNYPENFDALVRGFAAHEMQNDTIQYSEDPARHMYKVDNAGYDMITLDLQRGRDHGIPGYNTFRERCGLKKAVKFSDFKEIPTKIIDKLKTVYKHPNDIDLLIGGMAESPAHGGIIGPTFRCILGEQFVRTKKGDRFFYDLGNQPTSFSSGQLNELRKTSLAKIFCNNGDNILQMQPNVFVVPSNRNALQACTRIQGPDLSLWKENTL